MNKKDLKKFNHITKITNRYISYASLSFSKQFNYITKDDLMQDCYIKLLEIMKTNKNKPTDSIIQLYKTAIYNMMKDYWRHEKYRRTVKITTSEEETMDFSESDLIDSNFESNPENVLMFEHYCITIEEQLDDDTKKQFFKLLLYPDLELINISSKYLKGNIHRKGKTKKLIMNINKFRIKYSHIAERLNISHSTASRHIQEIKMIAERTLNDSN